MYKSYDFTFCLCLVFIKLKKKLRGGVPIMVQQKWICCHYIAMRLQVWSLASLNGLRIQPCHELHCSSQMWLRSDVAVAVAQASSYSCDLITSLGISICRECGPKKPKKKKKIWGEGEKNSKIKLWLENTLLKIVFIPL